ncbi:MAG: hypothetical protein R3A51_16170 [Nannocystaceae bacterium]
MTRARVLVAPLCLFSLFGLPACGDDGGGTTADTADETSESTTEGTTDPTAATTDATDGTTAGTDVSGSDTGTDTGVAPTMVPAHGISILQVEANQGVRLDIAEGPDWVDGSGRTSYLVSDRDTMLRVHFELADGWVPHDVEARLHLTLPNDEVIEKTQTLLVESDSHPGSLDRTFYFGLIGEKGETEPGTKFQIELYEEEAVSVGDEQVWASPADGPNLIGFEGDTMELKIVFVPLHYTANGQDITAEVTDNDKQALENYLHEFNPLQKIIIDVHSPYEWPQQLTALSPVLNAISQLRAQEDPGPNVYYHALVNQGCQFTGCTNGGLLGQAAGIPGPAVGEQFQRVAASMYHTPNNGLPTELSLETVVHEHGHTQGLSHVFCPGGGSGGNDPSFPDPNGLIEVWGFGIRYFRLHNPSVETDYMSYCHPQWVNPWTWNKTYDRIKTLTSWDNGDVAPDEDIRPLLIGGHNADGTSAWWTVDGSLTDDKISADHAVEFWIDGAKHKVASGVIPLTSEPGAYWLVTPLPAEVNAIEKIVHVSSDEAAPVAVDQINTYHRGPITLTQ